MSEKISNSRAEIMSLLTSAGIGSSIYYPQPVPRMTYYREKYGYDLHAFNSAALISDRIIALPVGPHLSEDDMRFISNELLLIINEIINLCPFVGNKRTGENRRRLSERRKTNNQLRSSLMTQVIALLPAN